MTYFASKLEILLRKLLQIRAQRKLQKSSDLWKALQEYIAKTKSTGCGYIDYACLYETVRTAKPIEVLECGTGVSTLVIAHALMENEKETGNRGRVTSMEEHADWLEMSRRLLPHQYEKFVDFVLSNTIDDQYSLFRGVRYAATPDRAYDFVFVDGPKYVSPQDGSSTFDFDYIHVLRHSEHPVGCLIDKRLSTIFVLQQLLGPDKVRYSSIAGLGFVSPCSRKDLGTIANSISSRNFAGSLRLLGNSRLSITDNR
ncbi:MAG: class I SAM-dependent methyltransferase [Ferrovibrio sp.]|uniref:class I SAM-dependent methyltransferase n=1 Tax=Ferrovibrio sp. TaxID=1917215 RepID=UPI00391B035E